MSSTDRKKSASADDNGMQSGGPSFHPGYDPLAVAGQPPLQNTGPAINVSTNAANDGLFGLPLDETEFLFDGTQMMSSDLYNKTAMTDAMPASRRNMRN